MTQSGEHGSLLPPASAHGVTAGSERRVFISYASHDAAVSQNVCSALEAAGFPCWMAPRDVVPGTLYADGIVRAINESMILVLILSKYAIESSHVGKELERGASKRHPIIALRTDAAPLTPAFEYFLGESQWIEVRADGTGAAIERLVGAVRRHLTPGSSMSPWYSPEGRAGTPGVTTQRRRRVIAALVVCLTLGAAYLWMAKPWSIGHRPAVGRFETAGDKSIAVLPFTDMSEKKDQEYLADGMAEEILDVLVKIPGLKVIGRTSSFQFKGQNVDLRTVGTQLGARYVLEGSVRKSIDRLRVTAQLIDSRDGTHLMSQAYDRDVGDVLKMQDEIAASLVRALQIEVGAIPIVSRPATQNSEAYALYLQGLHAYERYDQEGFEQAEIDLKRALELDPSMAAASAGLALVYDTLAEFGVLAPPVAFEQARHAAQHALKLDPNNALAHVVLGSIHDVYDWDWAAADRELRQAIACAPNDSAVLGLVGRHLMLIGRWDDALKEVNAALAQDPLNPGTSLVLNWVQVRRGRLVEAEAAARHVLEIIPTYAEAHYYLGVALLAGGRREEALAVFQKETDDETRLGGLAIVYHSLGRKEDSDAALARMQKDHADKYAFGIAEVYAHRGETEQALQWLDRAYAQKDSSLYLVKGDWPFRGLGADPRYKAFLRKMNLAE
jgi:TolB-like protein/tetratricopeptide (TPR) repeat protein